MSADDPIVQVTLALPISHTYRGLIEELAERSGKTPADFVSEILIHQIAPLTNILCRTVDSYFVGRN